ETAVAAVGVDELVGREVELEKTVKRVARGLVERCRDTADGLPRRLVLKRAATRHKRAPGELRVVVAPAGNGVPTAGAQRTDGRRRYFNRWRGRPGDQLVRRQRLARGERNHRDQRGAAAYHCRAEHNARQYITLKVRQKSRYVLVAT